MDGWYPIQVKQKDGPGCPDIDGFGNRHASRGAYIDYMRPGHVELGRNQRGTFHRRSSRVRIHHGRVEEQLREALA